MYLVIRVHSYRVYSLLCPLSLTNPIIIIIIINQVLRIIKIAIKSDVKTGRI